MTHFLSLFSNFIMYLTFYKYCSALVRSTLAVSFCLENKTSYIFTSIFLLFFLLKQQIKNSLGVLLMSNNRTCKYDYIYKKEQKAK